MLSAPVADAGGPYSIKTGETLQLDASGSTDAEQDSITLTYEWDLDGDGLFGEIGVAALYGDEIGMNPVFETDMFPFEQVVTVELRVTDDGGASDLTSTKIDLFDLPLQLDFAGVQEGLDGINTRDIATDSSGNSYIVGSFSGTIDADPGTNVHNLTSNGDQDIVISKLDFQGNLVWAQSIGGTDKDVGNSISVDIHGNIHITGYFSSNTVDFDPGPGVYNLTNPDASAINMFILKLSGTGDFQWSRHSSGPKYSSGNSITVDNIGNVYATGFFSRTVDFDPGLETYNLISLSSTEDIFILKLSSSGDFIWAKGLGSKFIDYGYSISLDNSGNIYTTGYFLRTTTNSPNRYMDFDPGPDVYNLRSTTDPSAYVLKLDSLGNFLWARNIGGERGYSISTDSQGSVYTSGRFSGTVDFNPGQDIYNLTSHGEMDVFISKLDSSGNFLWARNLGGTGDDSVASITVDSQNNIYTTGYFLETGDFDPGPGVYNLSSKGGNDIFVSKLDSSGNFLWAESFGSELSESASGLDVSLAGDIYLTGYFFGHLDFDPDIDVYSLTTDRGAFIARYNQTGTDRVNGPPSINAGGPYTVQSTKLLQLDASGTSDTGQNTNSLTFEWDLDGDDVFGETGNEATHGDETGINPTYLAPNVDSTEVISVKLKVTDLDGLTSTGMVNVTVERVLPKFGFGYNGNTSIDADAKSIGTDAAGNVYSVGSYEGEMTINPAISSPDLVSTGGRDGYLIKHDVSGDFVWAKEIKGYGNESIESVAIDGTGNILLTGYFDNTVDFDPGPNTFERTSSNESDAFLMKLNQNGDFLWVKSIGGTGSILGKVVKFNGNGNIIVAGHFNNTIDLDPSSSIFSLSADDSTDAFLAAYSPTGQFLWGNHFEGNNAVYINDIDFDDADNMYLTGSYYSTVDFNPDSSRQYHTSIGSSDVFLVKLNNIGRYEWSKSFGSSYSDSGRGLLLHENGDIYVTGKLETLIDDSSAPWLGSRRDSDLFVYRYNPNGNLQWTQKISGSSWIESEGIAEDSEGEIYVVGSYTDSMQVENNAGTTTLESAGGDNALLIKMDTEGNYLWALDYPSNNASRIIAISIDASDNILLTGAYRRKIDFDPGPGSYELTDNSLIFEPDSDIFISKLIQNEIVQEEPTYETPETLISYSTRGQQRTGVAGQRSVAAAADGRYVTTWWSDEGDGDGAGVFAQLYRADGSKVGGPFIVSTTTDEDQINPSAAMQADGSFMIAWQSDSDPGAGVNWEIHAQRYLASGLLDGGEIAINSELASNQSLADVVYLANGHFVVTWTGKGPGDANGIFARIFDASGNPQGPEFLVNGTTAGAQVNPSLTADRAGGFAAVWHGDGTGDSNGVFFRRFDQLGTALSSEVRVNQTVAGVQQTASVTQTNNDDFIVAWSGEGTGDSNGIFTRRLTPLGDVTGNEILVNQTTGGNQVTPSITPDLTTNGYLVTWSHQNSGNDYDIKLRPFNGSDVATEGEQTINQVLENRQWNPTIIQRSTSSGDQYVLAWGGYGDGDTAGVFTRALDSSLNPITPETLVSSSTKGQQRTGVGGQHAAATAADGRYVTTWWSDEGDGDGAGVFGLLYRADGSKVGGPFIVSTTTDEDQINPSVAMQETGQFVIVWQTDADSGAGVNWEIHGQRFLASGLLDGSEFLINSETVSNQTLADVVYLDNGSFVVTWTGKGPGDANGVFARIFDASGTPLGTEFLVNEITSGAQLNPSLTEDSAGGFSVVWHGNGAGDSNGVFFRRYDNAGTPLTGEVLVNETASGIQEAARVTQTATGDFIVTWNGEGIGDINGIFARRLSPAGALTGSETLVNEEPAGNQVTPSVVADHTGGGFLVVWSHQNSGIDYDIKFRKFDETDSSVSATQLANQVTENRQWNPTIIQRPTSEGNDFLVIWSGNGDGDTAGVFTRQFTFEEPIAALALSSISDAAFAEGLDEVLD
ncbi:SBBP repeat-containing protein [Polystyrenella longa]|nr:SBBP repeat-containing protein [Polystyrenella longa]